MLLSEAWRKMNHEKNQKQKISWHSPFKQESIIFITQINKIAIVQLGGQL